MFTVTYSMNGNVATIAYNAEILKFFASFVIDGKVVSADADSIEDLYKKAKAVVGDKHAVIAFNRFQQSVGAGTRLFNTHRKNFIAFARPEFKKVKDALKSKSKIALKTEAAKKATKKTK